MIMPESAALIDQHGTFLRFFPQSKDLRSSRLATLVDNYSRSGMNSNHWMGSTSIMKVVDANTKVMNTNNLVSISPFPFSAARLTVFTVVRHRRGYRAVHAHGQSPRHVDRHG